MGTADDAREVARRIEEIRNDQLHGASYLARQGVRTLALAAGVQSSDENTALFLKDVGRRLAESKPAMAAIGNMAWRFIQEVERLGDNLYVYALEGDLLAEMEAASKEAAQKASVLISEGARVLTCSHSSAVVATFKAAFTSGRRFRVAALASRVGDLALGERLAEELSDLGITSMLVADSAIPEAVGQADMAVVGADTLLPDGGIINGWPTLGLAQAARHMIPLYAVCEAYKMSANPVIQAGYELVPASLITKVVTDSQCKLN